MARHVHSDECSRIQVCACGKNRLDNGLADCRGKDILTADLNDAGAGGSGCGEQRTEIQIVSEDNPTIRGGVAENMVVGRYGGADHRPMNGFESVRREEINPERAEVHIDEQLHAGSASSISSTRQAA